MKIIVTESQFKRLINEDSGDPTAGATQKGNIWIKDPISKKTYVFLLEAGPFNTDITVKSVDLKNNKIKYIHPISGEEISGNLSVDVVEKIKKSYKTLEKITGIETTDGKTKLQLTRIDTWEPKN